jgi:hypothetical protein
MKIPAEFVSIVGFRGLRSVASCLRRLCVPPGLGFGGGASSASGCLRSVPVVKGTRGSIAPGLNSTTSNGCQAACASVDEINRSQPVSY